MSAPTQPQFNLSAPATALYTGLTPTAQSYKFDDAHHMLYALVGLNPAAGDLTVYRYDLSTATPVRLPETMTLRNFGHGQDFGIEVQGSTVYLWTECDAVVGSPTLGRSICRFPWTPNATLDANVGTGMTKYVLSPGSTANSPSIDGDLLLFAYNQPGVGGFIRPYRLSQVVAEGASAPALGPAVKVMAHSGAFQGRTVYGDYCYSISGTVNNPICTGNGVTTLYWQNIWTGQSGASPTVTAPTLPRREPEGIAVTISGSIAQLVWSWSCHADCTATSPLVSHLYSIPEAQLPLGSPAVAGSTTGLGGPLGCANEYRVYVFDRGGTTRIGEITPIADLQWGRVRDDISSALLHTAGFGTDCCDLLNSLRSMRHELVIYRDGVRVWEGPITRIAYAYDSVELEARDCMQYIYRRICRPGYNHTYPFYYDEPGFVPTPSKKHHWGMAVPMTVEMLIRHALDANYKPPNPPDWPTDTDDEIFWGGDDPNLLKYLTIYNFSDDARESRQVMPFQKTVWEEIDDLARNGGVDYVTIGRRIMVWDTSRPIGRTVTMDDSSFLATPIITEYGMNLATFAAVTDGQGYYGVDGGEDAYYGRVEILASTYSSTATAPDKSGLPSIKKLQQLQAYYYTKRNEYIAYTHAGGCLSAYEQGVLAHYYKERGAKGVLPARQKELDALIKPLYDRDLECKRRLGRMNAAKKAWNDAQALLAKYNEQITAYVGGMTSQAIRNRKGRDPAPVVVRIPDNSQLNPSVMLGVNDLIPGIWIPLRSNSTCRSLTKWQKLDSVNATFDGVTEAISVTLSPAPQSGEDPDADQTPPDG